MSLKHQKHVMPVTKHDFKWSPPVIHSKRKWVYLPLAVSTGVAIPIGYAVSLLKDNSNFEHPYGVQLALLGWLVIIALSIVGVRAEKMRYESMRRVLVSLRFIGDSLASYVGFDPAIREKQLSIKTIEIKQNPSDPTQFLFIPDVTVATKPDHSVSHALHLILTSMVAFIWEVTSPAPTFSQAMDILENLHSFASYGYLVQKLKTQRASRDLLCLSILTSLNQLTTYLYNNGLLNRAGGTGDNLTALHVQINDVKISIKLIQIREDARFMTTNLTLFVVFSVIVIAATPFLILPVVRDQLIWVYPVIVLILGWFLFYRWFIGDLFLNGTDIHTIHLYDEIQRTCIIFEETYSSIFNAPPQPRFDTFINQYFSHSLVQYT